MKIDPAHHNMIALASSAFLQVSQLLQAVLHSLLVSLCAAVRLPRDGCLPRGEWRSSRFQTRRVTLCCKQRAGAVHSNGGMKWQASTILMV